MVSFAEFLKNAASVVNVTLKPLLLLPERKQGYERKLIKQRFAGGRK